jgi:hypothetical protein
LRRTTAGRFFVFVHIPAMVTLVVLAHVGATLARRSTLSYLTGRLSSAIPDALLGLLTSLVLRP